MHLIKKYANRKLYDTKTKQSISMDDIAKLVDADEEFIVIDNQTGDDITASILSQLVGRSLKNHTREVPMELLTGLLRKGGGEVLSYARKYVGFWQRMANKAEGGIDDMEQIIEKGKNPGEHQKSGIQKDQAPTQDYEEMALLIQLIDTRIDNYLQTENKAIGDALGDLKKAVKDLSAKIDNL